MSNSGRNGWPKSHRKYTKSYLLSLDDQEYKTLKGMILHREIKYTKNTRRARDITRRLDKKRKGYVGPFYTRRVLTAKFSPCLIMDSLVPDRSTLWRKASKRDKKTHVIDIRNFSFIDNAENTFNLLIEIIKASCQKINVKLNFLDDLVLDIGPYLVLGVMMERTGPFLSGGLVTGGVRKILEVVKLREFLGMRPFGRVGMGDVWPLPLHQRRKSGTSSSKNIAFQPATFETTADRIVVAVNQWLGAKTPPESLTDFGAGRIKAMIGEILNNAERHGQIGGDGEWIAAGFMVRRWINSAKGNRQEVHICHLGFFNPGRPIGNTILTGPADTTQQINRYIVHHRDAGLSSQSLATVFALQDGVSRVEQRGGPTGGTGMMDLMEFANEVGQGAPGELDTRVVILSGTTCVRCENAYKRGQKAKDNRRTLWFNSPNLPELPPDNNYVKDLPVYFPGTLISLRFILDAALNDGVGKADEHDVDRSSETDRQRSSDEPVR